MQVEGGADPEQGVGPSFPTWSAIQRSCFGVLRPTHTSWAPESLMTRTISASSCGVSGRNGGVDVPATRSPGNRS